MPSFASRFLRRLASPMGLLLVAILVLTSYVRFVDSELYHASERRLWLLVAAVMLDLGATMAVCLAAPWRRVRQAVTGVVLLTLWALCGADVISLRFYGHYFNLSLLGEAGNLNGLGDSLLSLTRPWDYVVSLLYALLCVQAVRALGREGVRTVRSAVAWVSAALVAFLFPYGHEYMCLYSTWDEMMATYNTEYCFLRSQYGFSRGILKTACADLFYVDANRATTPADHLMMDSYHREPHPVAAMPERGNMIVVVVESLLSDVLRREGSQAVMPNLKALADSSWCHMAMESTAGPGYSSDGQLMLMTGIMGHRAHISVNKFATNHFPGLGHVAHLRGMTMALLEPTEENYWHQRELCPEYGIDSLYYFGEWTTDEALFSRAIEVTEQLRRGGPFVLCVLSISMHMPYRKPFEWALPGGVDAPGATSDYVHYLERCRYTDYHLGRYLDYLRRSGLMDEALLIVTSDHCPPVGELRYGANGLTTDLPLIIHGLPRQHWPSCDIPLRQQDLYPTLLDLLGATTHPSYPHWRGVGYSLFDTITPMGERWTGRQQQEFSEMLLETDFLRNED